MGGIERRLTKLVCIGLMARLLASPVRSVRLELLARLSFEELLEYAHSRRVDEGRVRRVAEQIGEPVPVVEDLLERLRREDLVDYTEAHEYARRCFEECGPHKPLIIDYYENEVGARDFYFVLHGSLHL